ncbi:MAG: Flp pilus assembly protein CpaB [Proteobacteria bacterium]|jgi:Flp pilus assembly protein CpaB|nr:Flp pilus assembly protein CpaB [Pseudomonadota bacterium]
MDRLKNKVTDLFHKYRDYLPVVCILLIGLLIIHQGVSGYKKKLGIGQRMTEILIASHPLSEGQRIQERDVTIQKVPEKYVPMGVIKPGDLYKIGGYALTRSIAKGEMILWSTINTQYSYQSASAKIEPGYRAVSIAVDSISSASNMVQPGDHVDLITTLEIPGESKPSTLTLLQNVTVLTVGEANQQDEQRNSYSSVTLMVLPMEANIITHSGKHGSLSLALRNPLDMKTSKDLSIVSDQDIIQAAFRNHMQSERDGIELTK